MPRHLASADRYVAERAGEPGQHASLRGSRGDGRRYDGFVLGYSGLNDATIETAATQFANVIEPHRRARR
ncbi:hypothetical protein LGM42_04595 [Burkholderia sp. AU39826]|nr:MULTISPECIES: hypothetical protein [Burkholderia]MCA7969169.1 hypothetical protein [Burkholderia sp. AU39826]MCA8031759.1 hypothetical protein [Burkholderia arboris]